MISIAHLIIIPMQHRGCPSRRAQSQRVYFYSVEQLFYPLNYEVQLMKNNGLISLRR
jgi:hypothetical protein